MIYLTTYTPRDRLTDRETEHRLGRLLLDAGLSREYGRTWEIQTGENGRPCIAEDGRIAAEGRNLVDFNISHTRGLVVCAVNSGRVGVDAQIILPRRGGAVRRALAPREQEMLERARRERGEAEADELFARLWTLKESYVKATGAGLSFPLSRAVFERRGGVWRGNTPGFRYHQARVYGRYIVTVCLETRGAKQAAADQYERGLEYDISGIV